MILLLFSGGVESTVLLKYFLKDTNELIYVLYTELNYDDISKKRITEQTKAATNVLNYLANNYRDFNYSTVKLNLNNITRPQSLINGFGFDPIFRPVNSNKTNAEMSMEEKASYNPRILALQKVLDYLQY